jgi:hypothetical protein
VYFERLSFFGVCPGGAIRALVLARVIHHGLQSRSLMGAYAAAGYLVRMCPSFHTCFYFFLLATHSVTVFL